MALVLAATLLALLAAGPLGDARTTTADGSLELRYERFARLKAPTDLELRVRVQPGAGEVEVALARGYLRSVRVEAVVPQPDGVELGRDVVTYAFALGSGVEEAEIDFDLVAEEFGLVHGEIAVGDGQPTGFRQLVYP